MQRNNKSPGADGTYEARGNGEGHGERGQDVNVQVVWLPRQEGAVEVQN